ncbi:MULTISPECIES: S41 family peptidase [unclassified Veillonella]|uniref:S41 family peptidase n=1 Tax=unclassified Veillonella TaxID=2630086 RepID=UPI001F0CC9B3|nr:MULTISPECIES: S41 family peptidase [unclassified Veillonella]
MKEKEKQTIWKQVKEFFFITDEKHDGFDDDEAFSWKSILKTAVVGVIGCILTVLVVMTGVFWYISGSPLGIAKFGYTYYITTQWAMDPPAKEELFVNMLKGLAKGTHDKHTVYLDKDDMKELEMHTSSTYSGIGLLLDFSDGKTLKVGATMEGQPAEAAGLQKGDQILAIDGTPVSDIEKEDVANRIRGEEGTFVVLRILRNGEEQELSIERKTIVMPTVKGQMLTEDIGYIRVTQFAEKTVDEFTKAYEDLQSKGMKRLVLDLRDNPGGLITTAHGIGQYLVPKGPIVTVQTRRGKTTAYMSRGEYPLIPLVVLINGNSASASEIIAGAVQDTKSGTIVGTKSYGKGTVQSVVQGLDGEGLKITIARYHTPNDRVIDGIGIEPDEVVEPSKTNPEEDVQMERAIEIVKTL